MSLLDHMKLREENDLVVYRNLRVWVALQGLSEQVSPSQEETGRAAATLMLQRLLRAFEQRAPSATKTADHPSGASINSKSNSAGSATNVPSAVPKKKVRPGRNLGDLSVLMLRRVKVTELVRQAVQFIGSDILKVLQELLQAPSVADVAHSCLLILKKEDKMKELYALFCKVSKKDMTNIDENSAVFFGVFAMQALETLRAQAISKAELAYDFEFLYNECYKDPGFQACAVALNPPLPPAVEFGETPLFAADTEARNICWKMSRLLALRLDYLSKRDSESKHFRRDHIISSAAAILMSADLGRLTLAPPGEPSLISAADQTSPASKRQKNSHDGAIPDFFDLILRPIAELVQFLSKNSHYCKDMEPITKDDLQNQLKYMASMISAHAIVLEAEKDAAKAGNGDTLSDVTRTRQDVSFLSTSWTPAKLHFVLHNYRGIIHAMVMNTERKLKLNILNPNGSSGSTNIAINGSGGRTAIGNVQFLFPMIIGEPWGIHRDGPTMSSKLLCSVKHSNPPISQKDAVCVVLDINGSQRTSQNVVSQVKPIGSAARHASTLMSDSPLKNSILEATKEAGDSRVTEEEDPPEARAAIEINMEEIEPPLFDDSMELNEWTLSILSLSVIKPSDTLLTYLGEHDRRQGDASLCLRDIIAPVLNRGMIRIQGVINPIEPNGGHQTQMSVGRKDGQVYVNGEVDENVRMCAAVVGFYYYSLESIIRDQMQRIEFLDSFNSLLQSEAFHKALLACCYSCVLKGVGTTQRTLGVGNNKDCTVYFLMQTIESNPYTFLKVTEALRRALLVSEDSSKNGSKAPIVPGLPVCLQQHLQSLETQLVDSIVWAEATAAGNSEGSLPLTIQNICNFRAWPPDVLEPSLPEELVDLKSSTNDVDVRYKPSYTASSESNFLSYVLRKLLKISFFRIQAICAALNMSNDVIVHTQIMVAFRYLMRHSIEMFFGRHVDQLLLCTIYAVCKVMKVRPEVSFGKLIDAYYAVRGKEQGERSCRVIVRHVKLVPSEEVMRSDGTLVGNLIVFYNQVFVQKMHKHFFFSKSLERSIADYRMHHIGVNDGLRPTSDGEPPTIPPAYSDQATSNVKPPEEPDDNIPAETTARLASVEPTIPARGIETLVSTSLTDDAKIADSAVVTMEIDKNDTSSSEPKPVVAMERCIFEKQTTTEDNLAAGLLQTDIGNLETKAPIISVQPAPKNRDMSSSLPSLADAMAIASTSKATSSDVVGGGVDPAGDRRLNSKSGERFNCDVAETGCGDFAGVRTCTTESAESDLHIDPENVSDATAAKYIAVESKPNGDGPLSVEAVGEKTVGDSQVEYLVAENNGGKLTISDVQAACAVVTVQIDEYKEIQVMEKKSIEGTDVTANGSHKRTFSTMGEIDTESPN